MDSFTVWPQHGVKALDWNLSLIELEIEQVKG